MVIFRESNLNVYLFTNLDTYQLIFKSGIKLPEPTVRS